MKGPFRQTAFLTGSALFLAACCSAGDALRDLPINTWVKLSPLPSTPPSPRLGYEGACAWDSKHRRLIRYGGHNQGGGGEQHAEVWSFDPVTAKWDLMESNTSPPGICCGQQNVFDPVQNRYVRFPAFSGSHGWQWWREIYLNDSSVWTYDPAAKSWRNRRPLPAPHPRPLRSAAWDSDHQVIVIFGGEGSREGTLVYDPYANAWTRMRPSMEPEFRSGGNMAYDAARKVHILFGSQFGNDSHTWAYALGKNEWSDLKPPELPPTDRNDAVLAYDPVGRRVLAIVKITTGKEDEATHRLETWTFDTEANRWKPAKPEREPDPSGNRARVLVSAPEHNVLLLENRTHSQNSREQQIWAYRLTEGPRLNSLAAPKNLRRKVVRNAVELSWDPVPEAGRYAVYRAMAEKPWEASYGRIAAVNAPATSYRDASVERHVTYLYLVRALDSDGVESGDSEKVRTQPPIVEDAVVSVLSPRRVEVAWSPTEDASAYHVERAAVETWTEDQLQRLKKQMTPLAEPSVGAIRQIGPFERITTRPLDTTFLVDKAVDLAAPTRVTGEPLYQRDFHEEQLDSQGKSYRFAVYAYRVRAVNALGVESGASPACFTLPSAPQWVFSMEDGPVCHLKWAANAEKQLEGYRIYRMDGRYDKDPIRRLTAEPIAATRFTDPMAGSATRRYYLVAVDALGQEGFPSAPVWFEREWKSFYQPFTEEWHQ